ncbi:hypothetical protein AUEXF2481DRAFT_130632 [Aureobasidium subglaciale EXF-2481]|uniref:Uncharacterized protein n=1 Tax=Aureobasidium subglaciale (strain EXF-2481) TaxID=1043005 RepID=A0A074ZPV7_AURSE|nr:uncharacterized protein AUEXF2481DRAFT_130632 [Aureobasidium subglaciale EXF-2481]KER00342.1 hypothetical protein AUEXF2481DRAFT_130632 [Aureobasidium subglaciale EXF-2481]
MHFVQTGLVPTCDSSYLSAFPNIVPDLRKIVGANIDVTMNELSDNSDAEDGDVSLIDYARYYGLSRDYKSIYPLSSQILQSILAWETFHLDFDQLPDFDLPSEVDLDEKWIIDRQSASFLMQIASPEVPLVIEITRRPNKSVEFKVEQQLLPTDPELEQRRFMRARRLGQHTGLQKIPSEALWQSGEEAQLQWPSPDLPEELLEQIKQEKLQLERSDTIFLQQCVSIPEKPEQDDIGMPPRPKVSYPPVPKIINSNKNRFENSMRLQGIRRRFCLAPHHSNLIFQILLSAVYSWQPVQ